MSLVSSAMILARHGELLRRSHRHGAVATRSYDARLTDAGSSPIAHPEELSGSDRFTRYEDGARDGRPRAIRIGGSASHFAVTRGAPLTALAFIPDSRPSTELTTWNP